MDAKHLVVYVDVDDTLVRSFGSKRIPMSAVVEHVRQLHEQGFVLYCRSTGGADYAENAARELGIERCFTGFLPKPDILIDDQTPADWRGLVCVHPNEAVSKSAHDYAGMVAAGRGV
ncbi:DUF705 domain-containing protein [Sorangium sp. So ce321]|uniref:DUF705 domain-containing protein n=1 Tax=Sorangium sp. So ce321 TaxID=3133300 RepID=UPI003F5D91F4